MNADLRGFEYPAEPLLRLRQWELDAALAEMGRVVKLVAQAKARHASLTAELEARARASSDSIGKGFDPAAHVRALAWMSALQARIGEAGRAAEELDARRDDVSRRLQALRSQVEAIETHREDEKREFATAQSIRVAAEADRDWLARLAEDDSSNKVPT